MPYKTHIILQRWMKAKSVAFLQMSVGKRIQLRRRIEIKGALLLAVALALTALAMFLQFHIFSHIFILIYFLR